jgi:hypothetical protein
VGDELDDVPVSTESKGVPIVRRLGVPAIVLTVALLLAGCGDGGANKGGMPVPAGDDSSASTTGTPTKSGEKPTTKPTEPVKTAVPPARVQVRIVVPRNFADNPAVQGLVAKYPLYFRALVERNDNIVKTSFPAYFYLDVTDTIKTAKSSGWVMRPPGSVVVMGVGQQPHGVVRLSICRSQTTQYWNLKTRKWVNVTPKGAPDMIDMVETGSGWTMYRTVFPIPKPFSCANVHFPA